MRQWRLILDDKCDGYYNMAADEAVLHHYTFQKIPTLRIYGWNYPFISLGYKQKACDVLSSPDYLPYVRRITGGAAILHNKEITYSITCSLNDIALSSNVKESYKILTSFLKEFYSQLGLSAQYAGDLASFVHFFSQPLICHRDTRKNENLPSPIFVKNPTLYQMIDNRGSSIYCFSSREYFDFIIEGKKIGGNAQRRRKDIIFQHGSIPQEIDFDIIHKAVKGVYNLEKKTISLNNLLGRDTDFNVLRRLLADSFKKKFSVEFIDTGLSIKERETCNFLIKNKYKEDAWNIEGINTVLPLRR